MRLRLRIIKEAKQILKLKKYNNQIEKLTSRTHQDT